MVPYFTLFSPGAPVETRFLFARGTDGLPDGDYRFVEFYCDDLECDCRRVIVQVWDEKNTALATFNFGWEKPQFYARWCTESDSEIAREMASATVEPLGPQSEYTSAFFAEFETSTQDPVYVAKLRRHYLEFRKALKAKARARRKARRLAGSKTLMLRRPM